MTIISAQAYIRIAHLRETVDNAKHLPPETLVLVRVDESPTAPAVRFVVLEKQTAAAKPIVALAPDQDNTELAGADGPDLLSMLMREVAARSSAAAPRILALELEIRKRLAEHDRDADGRRDALRASVATFERIERERIAEQLEERPGEMDFIGEGTRASVAAWIRAGGNK